MEISFKKMQTEDDYCLRRLGILHMQSLMIKKSAYVTVKCVPLIYSVTECNTE